MCENLKTKVKNERQAVTMAIYHCSVGNAKSATASDAYNKGEKQKDKITGKIYDYTSRKDVQYTDTILAQNAPQEWNNSAVLWQAVAEAEKKGARQAKKIEIALPQEWDRETQIEACREYTQKFVDKGHCVSFAIHDKGDGNPHAHILLTTRAIDKDGKFKPTKSKKIYCLDEQGNRIPLIDKKTGQQKVDSRNRKQWKSYKVEDMPCSSKEWVQNARQEWENILNEKLTEKVSCKSYEAQGINKVPTVHEGKGKRAQERKEQNRLIKAYNQLVEEAKHLMKELKSAIREELFGNDRREGTGTINGNAEAETELGNTDRGAEISEQEKRFAYLKLRGRADQIQREQEVGAGTEREQKQGADLEQRIAEVKERIREREKSTGKDKDGFER